MLLFTKLVGFDNFQIAPDSSGQRRKMVVRRSALHKGELCMFHQRQKIGANAAIVPASRGKLHFPHLSTQPTF
jgi:hypothetical protein